MILKHLRRQELGFSYLWQDVSIFQSLSPSENPQLRIFMFLIPPRNLAAAFLHLLKDLRIFMCGFRRGIFRPPLFFPIQLSLSEAPQLHSFMFLIPQQDLVYRALCCMDNCRRAEKRHSSCSLSLCSTQPGS
jgi:hypothetical protein